MNKNPFLPNPSYTPQQPPLPPGPPPPQPNQPDFATWWASGGGQQPHAQQPAGYGAQWPTAQAARPPAEQSALYANYGYGSQNNWQRQQQQQQQQQQPHYQPQVPPMPPPAPAAQPGYNPYQPATGYPQPYIPQSVPPPQPMVQPGYPPAQPQQQYFQPPVAPQQHHVHPHPPQGPGQGRHNHHSSPQHPPAKRQRFDGPNNNRHHQNQSSQIPPQPHFQPPPPPQGQSQPNFPQPPHGPSRGVAPTGPGGNRSGQGRGGGMQGRGGRGGGSMSGNNRGGLSGGRGRGGSFNAGSGRGGGGGGGNQQPGSLRNQNSRNNFSGGNKDFHNNRRGGSFNSGGNIPSGPGNASGSGNYPHQNSSFRGRNQNHSGPNRNRNDTSGNTSARDATSNLGKKDENRRTLTDFKIVGLAIPDLHWTWGSIPSSKAIKVEDATSVNGSTAVDGIKTEPNAEEKPEPVKVEQDDTKDAKGLQESSVTTKVATDASLPPSRIRIYFHTPVTADDARPIPHNSGYGDGPSDSRKGKRKKLEDDDGDIEERRAPPPPPQMASINHEDRSSVPASAAPSVAETASEGDWLMAAIVEGEDDPTAAGQSHPVDEDEDQLHISPVDAQDGHAMATDHDAVDDQGNHEGPIATGDINMHSGEVDDHEGDAVQVDGGDDAAKDVDEHVDAESKMAADAHNASTSAHEPSHDDDPSFSTSAANPSADHHESVETQGSPESRRVAKSLQAASVESTLLDIDNQQETQIDDVDYYGTQIIEDVKPSSSSAAPAADGASSSANSKAEPKPTTPSANRLSISYAHGNRRLVINAEVVNSLELFRSEGRIEVLINATREGTDALKGIIMEGLSEATKSYLPLPPAEESDTTIPNFKQVTPPSTLKLIVYLDTDRPLSEPKWAKSGDVQEWLKSMFGRMFWVAGDAAEGWEKKIHVTDPDPPPTIWTVLDAWATNSPVGALTERQRFLKTHLTEIDNILEILLRLVRGERATPFSQSAPTISAPSISGPLLSALSPASAHGAQQTHVSLAVLAIFRMTTEFAVRALGEKGKTEVEERIGEIVRCLPSHLIYKSLDGIFKEWRVEKKAR